MKILSFIYPGFTALDLTGPTTAWGLMPGNEFQFVSGTKGPVKSDMGLQLIATHDFADCWAAPDVVFVPGGGLGAFEALQNDALLDCIAEIGGRAQWLTSVCTGSLLLGAAGLLRGYRSACYWYARNALEKFGAIPDPSRTVIDRNRGSGGGVTAGIDFGLAMIGTWAGPDQGRLIELVLEYTPQPPFGVGRPELADAGTRAMATSILDREMPFALVDAAARRRGFVA